MFVKGCFQEMSGKMHAIIAEHIVGLPKHWGQMALEDLDHCCHSSARAVVENNNGYYSHIQSR